MELIFFTPLEIMPRCPVNYAVPRTVLVQGGVDCRPAIAGLDFRITPRDDALLGFEPFDPALLRTHGREYVERSQRLEF